MQIRNLIVAVIVLLSFEKIAKAVDILYVTAQASQSYPDSIITYDTSGILGSTIEATLATFVSYPSNFTGSKPIRPVGLVFNTSGDLYVSDFSGNTIKKFNSAGIYQSSITSDINSPYGMVFDTSGNLYVANSAVRNSTISKFNSDGVYLSSINTNLNWPAGLAIDASGNIYSVNGDSTISKFNSAGVYLSSINTNLNSPVGLAFDSSGNMYASNAGNNTISKFNASGSFLTSWSTGLSRPRLIAFKPVSVPEPSTYILATIAASTLAYVAHRHKK